MVNENIEYEKLVKTTYEMLLKAEGVENVNVQHDVRLKGRSGVFNQVDIYWEYRLAGITHRVLIECKNYNRAIDMGIVRGMIGLLSEMPGAIGIIATKVGFQSGAIELARSNNIGLKVIRPAEREDFKGRVREIHLHMNFYSNKLVDAPTVVADKKWLDDKLSSDEKDALLKRQFGEWDNQIVIRDAKNDTETTMYNLINSIPILHHTSEDLEKVFSETFRWEDAYIKVGDMDEIKILSITVKYRVNIIEKKYVIDGAGLTNTIVKDAIDGRLLFIDERGKVSGDVDEEQHG